MRGSPNTHTHGGPWGTQHGGKRVGRGERPSDCPPLAGRKSNQMGRGGRGRSGGCWGCGGLSGDGMGAQHRSCEGEEVLQPRYRSFWGCERKRGGWGEAGVLQG